MSDSLEHTEISRLAATAASLGEAAPDRHRFWNKAVCLTGDHTILTTENGRSCFLDSLRLLIKMAIDRLDVLIPPGLGIEQDADKIVNELALVSRPQIQVTKDLPSGDYDAILSVGAKGDPSRPLTVINSNGWTSRVASTGGSLSSDCSQTNAAGALAAACLGVAEVFKRLINLKPERGKLHDHLCFSFHSYQSKDEPGPKLPANIPLELLLVGIGAIGNGIVHLFNALPVYGTFSIVDHQTYGVENWGTCLRVGPKHFDHSKIDAAQKWLNGKLEVHAYQEKIEEYLKRGNEHSLIINALDNIPARRAVQNFWPDNIIDGAIGPVSCEVTLHPWNADLSCLQCDFRGALIPADRIQIQATGLREKRLGEPHTPITNEDVAAAPREKQEWLRRQKGKPVCSVISEGVLALMAGETQRSDFEPSVPFVACLSACMIVSELVRYIGGADPVLETGFQFDVMWGPQYGQHKAHARKKDCVCVTRRRNIELLRTKRRSKWFGHPNRPPRDQNHPDRPQF